MKVTKQFLVNHDACCKGMEFVVEHKLIGTDEVHFINELVELEQVDWAIWLLVRRLKRADRIRFAVYCAKDALPIFEAKYPHDDRPRKAIEAAEFYSIHTTAMKRSAAYAARSAARSAADAAADATRSAAYAARSAADAAYVAYAARSAADATYVAYAARSAARSAADATYVAYATRSAADAAAKKRYIEYGLTLLTSKPEYAKRKVGGRIVAMHTFLLGATSGHIDHIDGNGLNNQRNNLRMATPSQNGGNRKVNANNTTGFKGVCYLSKRNRYAAQIAGKTLGYFRTAKEAAQAYNAAAVSRYGDFAKLNTVE